MEESTLQQTPLRAWHVRQGARLVPFAGWEMPVQYTSILEEHRIVRASAGLFDVSHMATARIVGAGAENFLNYLATNEIGNLRPGRARYSPLCQPDGGTVDDVIVYRFGEEDFRVVLNASNAAKDLAWMEEHKAKFDVTLTDETSQWALLALQGPSSLEVLGAVTRGQPSRIARFGVGVMPIAGADCLVARTGYTGEDGFEIFVPSEKAVELADLIHENGAKPCGLGCRDSLRLEAGMPLYGHELSEQISPLQAGLGWAVKLEKSDFLGKEALWKQKEAGVSPTIVFFRLDAKWIAREGAKVFSGDREVGEVRSGSRSPILEKAIGSALVKTEAIESGAPLSVERRGQQFPLEVASPPLHKTT